MKKKTLRKIVVVIMILAVIAGAYVSVHAYANHKILNRYAAGFQKNVFGDYCKNKSNMVLSVYQASLFQWQTNLAVSNQDDSSTLIIWVPLFGGDKEYGLVIHDQEAKASYQIEVDQSLAPYDLQDEKIIKLHKKSIGDMKDVVDSVWNISL